LAIAAEAAPTSDHTDGADYLSDYWLIAARGSGRMSKVGSNIDAPGGMNMKRTYLLTAVLLGWASLAIAQGNYVGIGGTGNSWSQKPWCGY
jgi:hypothetical protein